MFDVRFGAAVGVAGQDSVQSRGTHWVCALTGRTAPGFSAISGLHTAATSAGILGASLICLWLSVIPREQSQLPCGRNVFDHWIVQQGSPFMAGYDTVMGLVLVPERVKLRLG